VCPLTLALAATPSPSPSTTDILPDAETAARTFQAACENNEGLFCTVLNALLPGRQFPSWITLVAGIVDGLLMLVLIFAIALVIRNLVHRLITKLTLRAGEGVLPERLRNLTPLGGEASVAILTERRRARAETIGSVLRSLASVLILGTATLMALARLGVELAPLLTSVGIIGVAVGFGAQELVKDFISGMFMLLEDQYGVGDVIDTGVATGTVEAVTLRITRLRDADGKVWYVRNGTITRIGNESQGWSRALVDVPVPPDTDVAEVRELLRSVVAELWKDPEYRDKLIVEEPEVYGLEQISGSSVIFRISVKAAPTHKLEVAREVRMRVKRAFDEKGLAFAG